MRSLRDVVVYDLEIKYGVLKEGEEPVPGVKYCKGWEDYEGMGISVLCAYSYATDSYRIFLEDNIPSFFFEYVTDDVMLVGFNNIKFDNNVLEAYRHVNGMKEFTNSPAASPVYDIQRELWLSISGSSSYDPSVHRGYGLEAVCAANGIPGKRGGGGALAPVNWQHGNYGAVIDYGMWDVSMTKALFDLIKGGRGLADAKMPHIRRWFSAPPEVYEFFDRGGFRHRWGEAYRKS